MQRAPFPRPLLLLAPLLLAVPLAAQLIEISNPNLFEKSLQGAVGAIEHYGPYDNPEELRRITDIGYRLAAHSDYGDFPFSFYLINMPEPNAFALPGGHIFVTRGMLGLNLDDDMLANLLGHEIAHVVHRHGTRMKKRATLLNLLSQALLLGVLVGADDGPENPRDPYGIEASPSRRGSLVQGTAALGMVVSELLLRDHSREFEDEADQEGQRIAAAAGFDPAGAERLWDIMNRRIPQNREYGYWRTHPFSDQRQQAARVRASELKIQDPEPDADYRALTQKLLLEYRDKPSTKEDYIAVLEDTALRAWPTGLRAEDLRLTRLHRDRDREMQKSELERDYGALVRAYRLQLEEVRSLTPESTFLARLEEEMDGLRRSGEELLPKALGVWNEGIYQTPFLETFLSNYPTADQVPEIALVLGNAYSRLGRPGDAVEQFLRAAEAGPESEAGQRALSGLRSLTPYLEELSPLQRLEETLEDEALSQAAAKRLEELSGTYTQLSNGAEYLQLFPEGTHAQVVRERLDILAKNLYGEVLLYQAVGDSVKALERIQSILTHAPTSPAADLIRDKAELDA